MKTHDFIRLLKDTAIAWYDDNAPHWGAALAFYSALSFGPLILIAFAVIGLIFGHDVAQNHLIREIRDMIGKEGAETVKAMLDATSNNDDHNIIATIIGVITLFIGASGAFGELQSALNMIWRAPERTGRKIINIIRERFLSMAMVMGIAFLLLISLTISALMAAVGNYASSRFEGSAIAVESMNFVSSFGLITVLFSMMYKILPDIRIAWRDVWIGAATTAFLFIIGKSAIGFYLGNSALTSGLGAAGSFIIILLWFYYSAQILFFGAEFTRIFALRYGSYRKRTEA